MLIGYHSNNSGGGWWLKDKDWKNLEKAGWRVVWADETLDWKDGEYQYDEKGLPIVKKDKAGWFEVDKKGVPRWLGGMARQAYKHFNSMREALQEFEKITGQDVSEEGCSCCGPPHSFSTLNEKESIYCSGEECLQYLFDNVPNNLRDACS